MTTFKLTARVAVATVALAAGACLFGSQVMAGAYDYGYAPAYGYPVSSGSVCPSGQCYPSTYVPSYSTYSAGYAPAVTYGTVTYGTGTCPNGNCGSCPNGRCSTCPNGRCGSCANGRCSTCPNGTCRSGKCPVDCPNGQCGSGWDRDLGAARSESRVRTHYRPEFSRDRDADDFPPSSRFERRPVRRYEPVGSERSHGNLESPFYN